MISFIFNFLKSSFGYWTGFYYSQPKIEERVLVRFIAKFDCPKDEQDFQSWEKKVNFTCFYQDGNIEDWPKIQRISGFLSEADGNKIPLNSWFYGGWGNDGQIQ